MVGDLALNQATEVRPLDPEPDLDPYPARWRASRDTGHRGPRGEVVRLYPCGNCGRRHRGYVVTYPGGPWGDTEYDFVATDWQGNPRRSVDWRGQPEDGAAPCL